MTKKIRVAATMFLGLAVPVLTLRADEKTDNAKARAEAVKRVYLGSIERWKKDPVNYPISPESLYQWSRRWMEAEQEAADKKADSLAAAKAHLDRMTKLAEDYLQRFKGGQVTSVDLAAVEFYRLDAENALSKAKMR